MTLVGLGRLSVDVHVEVHSSYRRFDSRKAAGSETLSWGGSVPWILAHAASLGADCHFVGPGGTPAPRGNEASDWFRALDISGHLLDTPAPSSYIEHAPNGALERVVSIREGPETTLDPETCRGILEGLDFDWLVLDSRHLGATRAAIEQARKIGAGVLLDPGSTTGIENLLAEPDLVDQVSLLVTDTALLSRLMGRRDPRDAALAALDRGVEAVVHTDDHGGATWWSRSQAVRAEPAGPGPAGSSLGLGDAFRGGLMAALDLGGHRTASLPADSIDDVLRSALAATRARKEQCCSIPRPVRREPVERLSKSIRVGPEAGPDSKLRSSKRAEATARAERPDRGLVVVVFGIPGAGKSTLARSLAERLRWPVFEGDLVGSALWKGIGDLIDDPAQCADHAMEIVLQQVAAQSGTGARVLLDAAMSSTRRWQALERRIDTSRVEIRRFWLQCPVEVAWRRVLARKNRSTHHFFDLDRSDLAACEERLQTLVAEAGWELPELVRLDTLEGVETLTQRCLTLLESTTRIAQEVQVSC